MTINEIVDMIDRQKPNAYELQDKIHWLDQLDRMAYREVVATHEADRLVPPAPPPDAESWRALGLPPPPPPPPAPPAPFEGYKWSDPEDLQDGDTVLLIPDDFRQVYVYWMGAMIDFANMEMARYTNSMVMFNTAYADYANAWNRTHMPLGAAIRGAGWRVCR